MPVCDGRHRLVGDLRFAGRIQGISSRIFFFNPASTILYGVHETRCKILGICVVALSLVFILLLCNSVLKVGYWGYCF